MAHIPLIVGLLLFAAIGAFAMLRSKLPHSRRHNWCGVQTLATSRRYRPILFSVLPKSIAFSGMRFDVLRLVHRIRVPAAKSSTKNHMTALFPADDSVVFVRTAYRVQTPQL
jgi:hypothetical protein